MSSASTVAVPCPKCSAGAEASVGSLQTWVSEDRRKLQCCQCFPSHLAWELTAGTMSYGLHCLLPSPQGCRQSWPGSPLPAPSHQATDGLVPRAGPSTGPWYLSFAYSNSFPIHLRKLTPYLRKMRSNGYDGPNTDGNSDFSSH